MKLTKRELFNGCLVASIAHAIMTNVYPLLSYEQSWDGINYSIHDSEGTRGTITFDNSFCVGAIRNDKSPFVVSGTAITSYMIGFPPFVIQKAYDEALQYLLLESDDSILPCVSSVFWADDDSIYCANQCRESFKSDFELFRRVVLPREKAIDAWIEYYDMNSGAIALFREIIDAKESNSQAVIVLNNRQKRMIPGDYLTQECIESFRELQIIV